MLTSCSRPSERRLLWWVAESVAPLPVLVTAGLAAAALWSFLRHGSTVDLLGKLWTLIGVNDMNLPHVDFL